MVSLVPLNIALLVSSSSSLVFPLNCLKLLVSSPDWLGGDSAGEIGRETLSPCVGRDVTLFCQRETPLSS